MLMVVYLSAALGLYIDCLLLVDQATLRNNLYDLYDYMGIFPAND
jgi:hypothetical protein